VLLSDGGENVRRVPEYLHPFSEHLIDGFPITMRVTVLPQQTKALQEAKRGRMGQRPGRHYLTYHPTGTFLSVQLLKFRLDCCVSMLLWDSEKEREPSRVNPVQLFGQDIGNLEKIRAETSAERDS
jgi:hypothetical protein